MNKATVDRIRKVSYQIIDNLEELSTDLIKKEGRTDVGFLYIGSYSNTKDEPIGSIGVAMSPTQLALMLNSDKDLRDLVLGAVEIYLERTLGNVFSKRA